MVGGTSPPLPDSAGGAASTSSLSTPSVPSSASCASEGGFMTGRGRYSDGRRERAPARTREPCPVPDYVHAVASRVDLMLGGFREASRVRLVSARGQGCVCKKCHSGIGSGLSPLPGFDGSAPYMCPQRAASSCNLSTDGEAIECKPSHGDAVQRGGSDANTMQVIQVNSAGGTRSIAGR